MTHRHLDLRRYRCAPHRSPWHAVTSAVCSCCWRAGGAAPACGSAEHRLARAGTKVSRSWCNMQRQCAPSLTYMLCVAVVQVDGRWWRSAPGGGFWRHFAAGDRRLGGPEMLCGELRSAAQPATAMGRDTESWLGCWWPEASGRRQHMSLRVTLAHWRLALFGALLCLNPSAAQPVVYGGCSSSSTRVMASFSLLKAGSWKASYVSLCAWFMNDNAFRLLPLRKHNVSSPLIVRLGRCKASHSPSCRAPNCREARWLWRHTAATTA